ncbi:MAG: hypothetical protein JXA37_14055 [Chloroflexia bacterium]|nr:hypothetical protein [Chloroflexia bacterium]
MTPVGPWIAFKQGFVRALRRWQIWPLFYLANVLLSGLLLWPLARLLLDWLGHSLSAAELADGLDSWLLADLLYQLGTPAGSREFGLAPWLLTLPLWPLLLSLPFVVLGGGALETYGRPLAEQGLWRLFWSGVRRYAWPFALLLLLEVLLSELSMGLGLLLVALVGSLLGQAGWTIAGAVVLALWVGLSLLLRWWIGYARIMGVLQQERRPGPMLRSSAAFLRRNLGPAAGLSLLHFPLAFLLSLLYGLLNLPRPPCWWVLQVLLQQLFVLGRLGLHLARLSTEVRLVQGRWPSRACGP